jgi:hypothetical protein
MLVTPLRRALEPAAILLVLLSSWRRVAGSSVTPMKNLWLSL